MLSEAKKLYNALKSEGILKQVGGKRLTGSWENDEKLFMEYYEEDQKLLNGDLSEETEEFDEY